MMPMRPLHGHRCALPNKTLVPGHISLPPRSHIKPSRDEPPDANILTDILSPEAGESGFPSSTVLALLRRRAAAMARKCSSCGNNGHNSRTCSGHGRFSETAAGGGGGGVRLFGVQLHVGSSSPMKKCFSMECLSSATPPAYYAAALAASSSSPSVSSSSSLVSVEETAEKMNSGYLSDGLMGRAQERKKGVPWTEDEHRRFLAGLEKLGKGDWRGISRHFVTTRTPTQVASHAQKYFLRQSSLTQKKRRSSLFDVVENAGRATSSAPDAELPALSLGISRPAKPERVLPPSLSSLLPRCSAATSSGSTSPSGIAAPKHRHPSSSLTPVSKPHQAPDLELKISTADHQTGSSPRTPFFGTIRVT